MGSWTVYVHKTPSNKHYVGITSCKPKERWRNGRGYIGQPFHNAIKKYGWDNIQHIILAEHLDETSAKELEFLSIVLLNSHNKNKGYNYTMGGDGFCGVRRYGSDNSFYGKNHSFDSIKLMSVKKDSKSGFNSNARKQSRNNHSSNVEQYDKNMFLIATFDSLSELERLGFRRASIRKACAENSIYKGCYWKKKEPKSTSRSIKVKRIDFDGNEVTYKSLLQAEKESGVKRSCISKATKKDSHYSQGYFWYAC